MARYLKPQSRAQKIENYLQAIDMVQSLHGRAFVPHLGDWRCGTQACLGGWIAQHPYFMRKGVEAGAGGHPVACHLDWDMPSYQIALTLFGDSSFFEPEYRPGQGSAKKVALDRLKRGLNDLLDE